MRRICLIASLAVLLAACGSKGEVKPEPPDSAMEKAVKAPLVDLNLLRRKIPDILRDARRAPYRMPDIATCDTMGLEIRNLDIALGVDLDRQILGKDGDSLAARGAEEAGDAATDAVKDLTTGWIPYRGWVRRLTGAERHSRELSRHIAAGLTRRAFLKGLGQSQGCVPPAAPAAPGRLYATWRLVLTRPAPWVTRDRVTTDGGGAAMPLDLRLLGRSVVLEEDALTGPHPLVCEDGRIERVESPAEGLFEGGLPTPADHAARNLGFTAFPVETLRFTCANASFDLHRIDGDTLALALDDQIWVLSSTVGTHAASGDGGSPEGIVQQLLEQHFGRPMEFSRQALADLRRYLHADLGAAIDHYFARLILEDEAPPISGDPFTDAQDFPTRFSVDAATVIGDTATVPVRFADAWRQNQVIYQLKLSADGWRIVDLRFRHGARLTERLGEDASGGARP